MVSQGATVLLLVLALSCSLAVSQPQNSVPFLLTDPLGAGGFVGAAPCPFAAQPPTNEQEALLDAAVREYVALAQGRSDAWAPPSPMPPAFNFAGGAGGVLPAL
jgi:hypothetical protein